MGDNRSTIVVALLIISAITVIPPLQAKFRDTVNFEDNQFVQISKIEVFHSIRNVTGRDSDSLDQTRLNYSITGGLMENFEGSLNVPLIFYDDGAEGIGDISIKQRLKFSDRPSSSLPASSGGVELIFPTGDDDSQPPTGTDKFNARVFGTLSQDINQRWKWLFHGGVTFYGENRLDERLEYNGALRYTVDPTLKTTVELNGKTGGLVDESELFLSPGFVFQTSPGFSIIGSIPIGLTSDSTDHMATVQFSHEF